MSIRDFLLESWDDVGIATSFAEYFVIFLVGIKPDVCFAIKSYP